MTRKQREKLYAKLDAIYARSPEVGCRGLCGRDACGALVMSDLEWHRIEEHLGGPTPKFPGARLVSEDPGRLDTATVVCPLLREGRCSVYPIRPMTCRLWGCVKVADQSCPHGCVPEAWLTYQEGCRLTRHIASLSGTATPRWLTPKDWFERRCATHIPRLVGAAAEKLIHKLKTRGRFHE